MEPASRWVLQRSALARRLASRDDPLAALPMSTAPEFLANQVVLIGHGRVGRTIAQALQSAAIPFVVVEQQRELVERLRAEGRVAVLGDAADSRVLVQAHIATARQLVIATPQGLDVGRIVGIARTLNPGVEVVLRSHNAEEADRWRAEHAGTVFVGEQELARAMSAHVLERVHAAAPVLAASAPSGGPPAVSSSPQP